MTIHLTDDAQPFFQSAARPLPYAWRADGAALLQRMVQQGIIAPLTSDEPSDWQHPITFTPKSPGGLRACSDLRRLNQFVRRRLTHVRHRETQCPKSQQEPRSSQPWMLCQGIGKYHLLRSRKLSRLSSRRGVATDIFAHLWAFDLPATSTTAVVTWLSVVSPTWQKSVTTFLPGTHASAITFTESGKCFSAAASMESPSTNESLSSQPPTPLFAGTT